METPRSAPRSQTSFGSRACCPITNNHMNLHKERTMTIKANIEAKIERLQQEKEEMLALEPPDQIGPEATEMKNLAIAAVLGDRDAFIAYMKLFATNDQELARLIPTDGTQNDPVKRE